MPDQSRQRIAIVTCATKSYQYALPALIRAVSANLFNFAKIANREVDVLFVMVGDAGIEKFRSIAKTVLPTTVDVVVRAFDWQEGVNYQKAAQLTIAQMRTMTVDIARRWGADYCWSLDSDVLPKANSLLCSLQMLEFDGGYYSVAACPYPSQGGGSFLTGRGSKSNPILPDFDLMEREVGEDLLKEWDAILEHLREDPEDEKLHERRFELQKRIEETCPPKHGGNIWKLNAEHGWRRRGWFDFAYPALGRGSIVPSDWCGFGCTLMNAEALSLVDFSGYDGSGTEDLFIIWHRWFPRRLQICSIPHCPADHIVRTGEDKKLVHCVAYHEEHEETKDHLRRQFRPFYQHSAGEVYDPTNDGVPAGAKEQPQNPTRQRKSKRAPKQGA
jgi:hypothetical protein